MGQQSTGHFDGLSLTGIAPGSGANTVIPFAGVPGGGTDEVQTATLGGTGAGSTFKLALDGVATANITWSSTNSTLLSNINAALNAKFGTSQIVASDSTLSSGLGDLLLTFSGSNYQKSAVTTMTATVTAGALTVAIAETTPGVDAAFRGWPAGQVVMDVTNKIQYVNTGTATAPTWTKTGLQS